MTEEYETEHGTRPLSGIKVLDIASFIAGPYAATLLGDFGADVVKVELPEKGDSVRWLGAVENAASMQWRFLSRNKRAITLDLRTLRGRELLLQMVAKADVVVENFTPGTLEGWGLSFEEMRRVNEGIILVRVSGFGQNGPDRTRPAVARIAMAFGGLLNMVGEPNGPPLLPGLAAIGDYIAGVYAAFGAMVALRAREVDGRGQQVDLALFEPIFHMLEDSVEVYGRYGTLKQRVGSANRSAAPHNNFQTADGSWVAVGCSNDELFSRLCDVMERKDLLDLERFSTNPLRVKHRGELEKIVADWIIQQPPAQVVKLLREHEVPSSRIYTMEDIFEDEQYKARDAIIEVETEDIGTLPMRGVIPRLSRTPGSVQWPGRSLGHDNDEVFREELGLTTAEIEALEREGTL